MSRIFLPLRKVEFIKWISLINVLFIGFVKEWFSAEDQFCVWFVSLDCGKLENFSEAFSKKETALSFFFLLVYAFCSCSMLRQYFFCTYLLPKNVKYCLNSQNFPPFKKNRGKNFVMMTSIVHLSSDRS